MSSADVIADDAGPAALPLLPAPAIRRERIATWLEMLAGKSARLLVAPAGFGKTTVLVQHAHDLGGGALFVRCSRRRGLAQSIAAALGEPRDEAALVERLQRFSAVLLDDLECATSADESLLDRLVQNPRLRNVVGATTRRTVVRDEHVAAGIVSVCTQRLLAFEPAEIAQLALALGLHLPELEALELRERSEGWPLAVTGALRTAHAFGNTPAAALAHWTDDQRTVVLGLFERYADALPSHLRDGWKALLAGRRVAEPVARQLEALGAPVVFRRGAGYQPLRIVKQMQVDSAPESRTTGTMAARMFGRFECALDGVPVVWARRMDRRLVRYLLLTRDGGESKEQILERFWPGQDAAAALQSLRTTCSTIKKSIATLVGSERVGDYFTSGDRIAVNLEHVSVDVRRFISHMRTANSASATGAYEEALYHYRHADGLYTAHLGWGDDAEEWLDQLAAECRTMRMDAMRSSAAILRRLDRLDEAHEQEMLLNERAKRHEVVR